MFHCLVILIIEGGDWSLLKVIYQQSSNNRLNKLKVLHLKRKREKKDRKKNEKRKEWKNERMKERQKESKKELFVNLKDFYRISVHFNLLKKLDLFLSIKTCEIAHGEKK